MKYVKLLYMLSILLIFDYNFIVTSVLEVKKNDVDEIGNIEKVLVPEVKELYQDFQKQIQVLQDQLLAKISERINDLESYSAKNTKDFVSFLDDAVIGFRYQVKILADQIISDYFLFLQQQESNSSYGSSLTASQLVFVSGINHIVEESLVIAQKMILDLTSEDIDKKLSLEIKHGFFESERHAQLLYEKQLKANEKVVNKDWWDQLKGFGNSYLKELKVAAKDQIGKEVAKQTQEFINEVGSEIASEVGKKLSALASEGISPAISEKLAGLREQLGKINPVLKEKLAGLTDKLKGRGIAFWESGNPYNDPALSVLRKVVRWKNPVKVSESVSVRTGKGLCSQEREYLKKRSVVVQEVLQKNFGINKPLRIAFCCSGGGNRAMIGTLGIFMAAAKYNILQATTYMVGLSGSTWTIAPWFYLFAKGLIKTDSYQESLTDIKDNFIATLSDKSMLDPLKNGIYSVPMLKGGAQKDFANQMVERFSFEQPISAVNLWGALVGNYALNQAKDSKLNCVLSDVSALAIDAKLPLPLCSAAFAAKSNLDKLSNQDIGSLYEWFEIGLFEAGSKVLGYIPIKYFGSIFNQGDIVSELACPEYPLSFYLGVCGSFFSLSLNDLVNKGLKDPKIDVMGQEVTIPISEWVKKILEENIAETTRSKRDSRMHAQFANFSKGMSNSYLKDSDLIELFDGASAFNIPLPLVLDNEERAVDIVIIYDAAPGNVQALQSADKYFKRKNIHVPSMSNVKKEELLKGKYPMTVFNDPRDTSYNSTQPTLIYFSTNVDTSKPPFITANFKYTESNINNLMSKASDSFENHIDDIKIIMKKVSNRKDSPLSSNKNVVAVENHSTTGSLNSEDKTLVKD